MGRQVALLRGINVGGHHKLPMADLRGLLAKLGATDVATYIQSGNAVFCHENDLSRPLSAAIEAAFGFPVPVITRPHSAFQDIVDVDPFPNAEAKYRHVGFLSSQPDASRVAVVPTDHPKGERFEVIGTELHLWFPNGLARTKLTNKWFERQLDVQTVTLRNWRTVNRLLGMV